MDGSFVRKLGLVTGGLLLSALSALVMEWWMSISTPGAVAVYYLFNPGGSGPVNASLVIATHLGTLCNSRQCLSVHSQDFQKEWEVIRLSKPHALFLLVAGLFLYSTSQAQQPQIQITAPSDRSLVYEGETLIVTVAADPSVQNLWVTAQSPLPEAQATPTAGHFAFNLATNIPPGLYQVGAIGSTSGRPVFAAPIHVDIERQDTPKYLVARPDSIVLLAIGDTVPINVLGVYPTGGALPFSHSTRTTYTSNNTQIVTVDS